MKRKSLLLIAVLCLLPAFLWSCGNGPGAPGSSGSEDTGIQIKAVTITGNGGPDLDAAIHLCPPDFTRAEPGLFRDDATITVTASQINPTSNFDPFPASVEQCTITYIKPVDNPNAPVIDQWTIYPNCTINNGTNSCVVNLIDIARKDKFWADVLAAFNSGLGLPSLPVRYVAAYDCSYVNNMGNSGRFKVELEIFLTDFELCG